MRFAVYDLRLSNTFEGEKTMNKEKKNAKMEEDCGGIKPYNPIKPPKKTSAKKADAKKADTKKK